MRANLHIHSVRSDGTLKPREVAQTAAGAGLEAAALTDHDTLGGVPEFLEEARRLGLAAWPGAEIDVADRPSGFRGEVLAYFPGGEYGAAGKLLAEVAERRRGRARSWMSRVPEVFSRPDLSYEGLLAFKAETLGEGADGGYCLAKTDLYLYLKARGALPPSAEYREFRKAYLDTGLLPGGKYRKPELSAVVETVRSDGGVCVLPHPGHEFGDSLRRMEGDPGRLRRLLERMREVGVRGVELYYYPAGDTEGINRLVARTAAEAGLFLTWGSDCHGPGSGKDTIRDFSGDFPGWPER